MASAALASWRGARRARIEQLKSAHDAVRVPGPGRKWNTEQLNRALVLVVMSEFQGFARDLHDLAVDVFVTRAADGNQPLGAVIRGHLTSDRKLSKGNANPGALGSDFGRLGLALWPALAAHHPAAPGWNHALESLNEARNAIAHADEARLLRLRSEGHPITLREIKRWRSTLDALSATLDAVVSRHLADLFAASAPW
jgi:hypothetical protein